VNLKYIAKIMSDDWGFYYTTVMNLNKIQAATNGVPVLSNQDRIIISEKAEAIIKIIENEPKSGKWKGRAKTGAAKIWYKEVSDWE